MKIKDYFPFVYQDFLPEFFENEIVKEKFVECNECRMLKTNKQKRFLNSTKCCTYHPSTPNYLVGEILLSNDKNFKEGKERILAKINKKIGVSPLGIYPSKKYLLLYEYSKDYSFGKNIELRCPYYDIKNGSCTIWIIRGPVCSTYFCKYNSGSLGKNFWINL